MAAVGVSFGDTSAAVACERNERTDIIANELGERLTPTLVAFSDTGESVVGLPAQQGLIRNAKRTVGCFHSLLGGPVEDQNGRPGTCTAVTEGGQVVFKVPDVKKPLTPVAAASMVLRNLKTTAEAQTGASVKKAVYAVPVGFSAEAKKGLSAAAEQAGLRPAQLISEPTAAVLAYQLGQDDRSESLNALVVDVGGTNTSVTVVMLRGGMYHLAGTASSSQNAGAAYSKCVYDHLANEFKRKTKLDVNEAARSRAKLASSAEAAKKVLSTQATAAVTIDSLHEGVDFQASLMRSRMEGLVMHLVRSLLEVVQQALTASKVGVKDIDRVVLAGGGAKLPKLKSALQQMFAGKDVVLDTIPPDEVYAIGAAVQAALLLEEDLEEVSMEATKFDACPVDLGIMGRDGSIRVVLPKLTPVPAKRTCRVCCADDGQESVALQLFAVGDPPKLLGRLTLKDIEVGDAGETIVSVTVILKKDGSLEMHAEEPESGAEASLTIPVSAKSET